MCYSFVLKELKDIVAMNLPELITQWHTTVKVLKIKVVFKLIFKKLFVVLKPITVSDEDGPCLQRHYFILI
jgi:hypothetical protein